MKMMNSKRYDDDDGDDDNNNDAPCGSRELQNRPDQFPGRMA